MEIKIVLFINLLTYSFIVSQSFFYIIALEDVQRNMQPLAYIELRKLLDKNFRAKFKYPFYATLVTSPLLAILAFVNNQNILFICALIATAGIIIDTIIMLKGKMPINNLINTWSPNNYPQNGRDTEQNG